MVTIEQMIRSDRGAAETMQSMWLEFQRNPRVAMRFVQNSSAGAREAPLNLRPPNTKIRRVLHEIVDAQYRAGRITESVWRRIEEKANREFADRIAKLAVEDLNRLAREKAARKSPSQAA